MFCLQFSALFIAVTLTDFVMRKVYMYSDYIEV